MASKASSTAPATATITQKMKFFQPKKGSVRFKAENDSPANPVTDVYISRVALMGMGVPLEQQDSPELTINVTFSV